MLVVSVLLIGVVVYKVVTREEANDIYATVSDGPFEVRVRVSGELQAKNSQNINAPSDQMRSRSFRVSDVQIKDLVPEGTVVDSGAYVGSLDRQVLSNQLKTLEDDVEKAEQQYLKTQLDTALTLRDLRSSLVNMQYAVEERELVLEQSKFEPPATIRQAELNLEKAQRELRQAQENYQLKHRQSVASMLEAHINLEKVRRQREELMALLERFTIYAPKQGMVIYHREWNGNKRKVGSSITPWDPIIATLPDLSEMVSQTFVNEIDISRIKVGQEVQIGVDAFPDRMYRGTVYQVANVGEQIQGSDARVFEVMIRVLEQDTILRPSMTTNNAILISSRENAVYCPLECLHTDDSATFVYTANRQRREVRVGESSESHAVILEGVSTGETLYLSQPETPQDFRWVGLKPEEGER